MLVCLPNQSSLRSLTVPYACDKIATGGDAMTIQDMLGTVRFVVHPDGRRTAVLIDMDAWEAILSLLQDLEDTEIVQERIKNWRTKEGWTRWEAFEQEPASAAR